jgi:hypothetical protein
MPAFCATPHVIAVAGGEKVSLLLNLPQTTETFVLVAVPKEVQR